MEENTATLSFVCPLCKKDITATANFSLMLMITPFGEKKFSISSHATLDDHECI